MAEKANLFSVWFAASLVSPACKSFFGFYYAPPVSRSVKKKLVVSQQGSDFGFSQMIALRKRCKKKRICSIVAARTC